MSIALELGTREFRSLRREGHRLIGRSCPCVYVVLPDGSAERKLLDQARIRYSACQGSLVVLGQPAIELARSLKLPCLSPFEAGRLPPGDIVARQVVAALIDAVIPARVPVQYRCMLAVPGEYRGSRPEDAATSHRDPASTAATLAQFVKLKGYAPTIASTSYAVGLSELGRDRMSGIALHVGSSECQVSLLHQGRELVHAGIPRGEDSLFNEWARRRGRLLWDYEGHCYLHQMAVREWWANTQPSLTEPCDEDARTWRDLVFSLTSEVIATFLSSVSLVPGTGRSLSHLPLVVSGGITATNDFLSLLKEVCAVQSVEFSPAAIRAASNSCYSVVRGLLIYSEGLADDAPETARPLSRVG